MKRSLLLLTASALLLSGCALLADLLSSVFQQPTFRFKGVTLRDASLSGVSLDTTWQIDNPNSVGLSLASVEYALFIDGKQVVAGKPPLGVQIPAMGTGELVFPASFKFLEVFPAIETMLTRDTATWRVEGKIGLDTPVGLVSLPLAAENTFETPKLPDLKFADPKVTNVSITGATVEFPLKVTSRSNFPILIESITGGLWIAGTQVGTLSTGNLGALQGKGIKQLSLPLTISFFSAGSAVVSAVQGGDAKLKFDAQVHSGGTQVPIKLEQLVNFVR